MTKEYLKMDELEELLIFSKDENGDIDTKLLLNNININIAPIVEDAINKTKEEVETEMRCKIDMSLRSI